MRWLFLIALFLNIAYIAWHMLLPATDLYVDMPVLKNVESIVLLAELKQRKKTGSDNTAVNSEQKSVELAAEAETVPAEAHFSGRANSGQRDSVEKIEESINDAVIVPEEPVTAEAPPEKSAEPGNCFTLGAFRDLGKLRSFIQRIKPYVLTADFRGQEESRFSVYWVYLPPEKSRRQAVQTGKRLKDKKIKDFYIIREGEKNNGISLGYFRSKSSATRLEKKVKNLGFDVLLEPVYKTFTFYWLDYQLVSGKNIPEVIFEEYSQLMEAGKISRLSRDCGA